MSKNLQTFCKGRRMSRLLTGTLPVSFQRRDCQKPQLPRASSSVPGEARLMALTSGSQ